MDEHLDHLVAVLKKLEDYRLKANRDKFKNVRANCFCASLLRTKFTRHVLHRARALSSKVNNNRANGHCYNFAWI